MRNLLRPGELLPIPASYYQGSPSNPVYTATDLDLGMQYCPMVIKYARGQYRGLINMPKYGIFSGELPQDKNEVQYDQWIFEVEDSQKMYGRPWWGRP